MPCACTLSLSQLDLRQRAALLDQEQCSTNDLAVLTLSWTSVSLAQERDWP